MIAMRVIAMGLIVLVIGVVLIALVIAVIARIVFAILQRVTPRLAGQSETEPAQDAAPGFPQLTFIPFRQRGRGIRQHARTQIRERVQQSRDEHVARDAADRVKMDVAHRVRRPDGPERHTGPRG
jgi:hypothetical protein